jgi:plasmid maintenance system antidote protein VapI
MGWFSKNRAYTELRGVIKKNGIKQSWIAEKLGISAPYLSLILNRKRRLTEEMEDHFIILVENIKGDRR